MEKKNLYAFFQKNRELIQRYLINLSVLLVFWGTMTRQNFNSDTLAHFTSPDADIYHNMQNGRYLKALGDFILFKLGMRTTDFLGLTVLAALIVFAFSLVILQVVFKKWEPKEGGLIRIAYYGMVSLVFLNVLFAENLMFTETCIYFALAYLFASIGIYLYVKKRYVLALVSIFLGTTEYQYAAMYAAMVLAVYVMMDEELTFSKRAVVRELVATIGCMLMGVMNLVAIKILDYLGIVEEFVTDAGDIDYLGRLKKVFEDILFINKSADGLLPAVYLPLLITVIGFGLILAQCIKKKTLLRILFVLAVYVGCYVILYSAPYISIDFYVPGRMAFCFFLFQGLLAATALVFGLPGSKKILSYIFVGYLLIQCIYCGFIVSARMASNRLDRLNAVMVDEAISAYEDENGIKITKLAVCKDADAPDYYEGIGYHAHQINERVSTQAPKSLIEFVTGRQLEKVLMDETLYEEYFSGRNWDIPNMSEQLVFVDDTVYWCLY